MTDPHGSPWVALAFLGSSGVLDWRMTEQAVARGWREMNPLVRRYGPALVLWLTVVPLIAGGLAMRRGLDVCAWVLGLAVAHWLAAGWGYWQIRRAPR